MRAVVPLVFLLAARLVLAESGGSWLREDPMPPPARLPSARPPPRPWGGATVRGLARGVECKLLEAVDDPDGGELGAFAWGAGDDPRLLVAGRRVFALDPGTGALEPVSPEFARPLTALATAPGGALAVGTDRGVAAFRRGERWVHLPLSLRRLPVRGLAFLSGLPGSGAGGWHLLVGGSEILHVLSLTPGGGGSSATLEDAGAWAVAPGGGRAAHLGPDGRPVLHALRPALTARPLPGVRPEPYTALAFSPDGTMLLTGLADGWVQSFRLDGNLGVHHFRKRSVPVTAVAYAPDMTRLAVAYQDGLTRLVAYLGTAPLAEIRTGGQAVTALGFSPEGDELDLLVGGRLVRVGLGP